MQGIKDRVAIVGMGCTKFGERWDVDGIDLLVEAGYEAYEDAGIEPKDIQAAWFGTASSFSTGQPVAQALKLNYIPITRVENACATATDAFRNACYAVAAGIYDVALAIGVEKLKDSGFTGLVLGAAPGANVDPPVPPPSQFALAAALLPPLRVLYEEGRWRLRKSA
jgi:acetyl-CoA C-acetyltransferase